MFGNIGSSELIILGIIVFFLFGSKKLNELARGLGESSKEVKKLKKEFNKAMHTNPFEDETDDEAKKDGD
jgi:sec-independent protein translocase protein TatA